jgi:hypothetical protein
VTGGLRVGLGRGGAWALGLGLGLGFLLLCLFKLSLFRGGMGELCEGEGGGERWIRGPCAVT